MTVKNNTWALDLNNEFDSNELDSIPEKLFYSVGEVAKYCGLDAHTLRFWEKEFPQLRPHRRSSVGSENTRRYYRREDIQLIKTIKVLRYDEGFTIAGVKQQLEKLISVEGTSSAIAEDAADHTDCYHHSYPMTSDIKKVVVNVIDEIKILLKMLKSG